MEYQTSQEQAAEPQAQPPLAAEGLYVTENYRLDAVIFNSSRKEKSAYAGSRTEII